MRIRTIKPEFWQDEKIASFPFLTRLVYIALWNESDDQGRLRGSPVYLKSVLFPYDDVDLREPLESLKDHGMLTEYTVRQQTYLHLENFSKHQRINRPSASKLPDPNEADLPPPRKNIRKPRAYRKVTEESEQITESSLMCDVGKEQGREGKGTGKGREVQASEPVQSGYKLCIAKYYELYEIQSDGKKPRWNARNGRDLKALLSSVGEVEVVERMEWMFAGKSWLKPPYTFGSLVTNWDSLVKTQNGKGGISGDDLRDLAAQLRERGE
jgi:hypothetical protein